jgi:hypothetical protein
MALVAVGNALFILRTVKEMTSRRASTTHAATKCKTILTNIAACNCDFLRVSSPAAHILNRK